MLTSNAYFDQHEVVFHRAVCVSWRLERRDLSGESPVLFLTGSVGIVIFILWAFIWLGLLLSDASDISDNLLVY